MSTPLTVVGDRFGIDFPVTVESFLSLGADFLTPALQASGSLTKDNSITEIRSAKEFMGGGMGRKLVIEVSYKYPSPTLSEKLFVKFPREFGDSLRDLFNPVMASEVNFALLSRQEGFPVHVATCYFADSQLESQCHILITDCIRYGEEGIEPHRDKCLDYQIDNPLPYYQALAKALGRLAGRHKAGALGSNIDTTFPFSGLDSVVKLPFDRQGLEEKLEKLQSFMATHPALFPDNTREPQFLNNFSKTMLACFDAQDKIRHYLTAMPDLIALCHWNANIDNAWFWRDENDQLQVGLLDWGSVGQMNIAQAFFGMTCGAEPDFLRAHRDDLMQTLLTEYRLNSGINVELNVFKHCVVLATSLLGMAWMLDAPTIIEAEMGGAVADLQSRYDSRVVDHFLVRAQLHLLTVLLCETDPAEVHLALGAL